MVVVVPALSQGDQSQKQAIAAGIGRLIAHPSKHVAQRVDDERAVIQEHGADEEPPNESLPPHQEETSHGQDYSWDDVKSVQPTEFWILGKVLNRVEIRGLILAGQDPTDMRPPEALAFR